MCVCAVLADWKPNSLGPQPRTCWNIPEAGIADPFDLATVKHTVLAGRQGHVVSCTTDKAKDWICWDSHGIVKFKTQVVYFENLEGNKRCVYKPEDGRIQRRGGRWDSNSRTAKVSENHLA